MVDISIQITLNHKEDIYNLISAIKNSGVENPVYIVELPESYEISFNSYHDHSDIQKHMSALFPDYDLCETVENRSEIRMVIHRSKSPFSTDDWERRFNSDIVSSTVYLVKEEEGTATHGPNPKFKVLFGEDEKEYKVNIVPGRNTQTNEEGFIVVDEINTEDDKAKILINELFPNRSQAFWKGYNQMTQQIEEDYRQHQQSKTRRRKR